MADTPFTGLTAKVNIGEETVAYISGCSMELSKEIIEIMAFGKQYKEKVPAIKDWSLSMDGTASFSDSTSSQKKLLDAFDNDTKIEVKLYLNDNTYFTGSGYVSSISIDAAPDDKISISGEIAGTDAVVATIPGGV